MRTTKQPIHLGDEEKTSGRFRKSKPRAANATKGDEAKFLSYAEAWARIRAVRKHGFFLEAVTIQESIISDRLSSFVVKNCGEDPTSKSLRTLHNLTGMWIKLLRRKRSILNLNPSRGTEAVICNQNIRIDLNKQPDSSNEPMVSGGI